MKNYKVKNPILIRFFNRPEKHRKLMKVIKKVKPSNLYLFSDGPKNEKDKKLVEKSRLIACDINWKCKVKKKFLKKNLGAPKAGYLSINWFFSSVKQGIVLEDDNIPNVSFFKFCDELLKLYKNDERIGLINGNNFQNGKWRGDGDYYFSKYFHSWGWAAWQKSFFDWELIPKKKWSNHRSSDLYDDKIEKKYWKKIFNNLISGEKVHWDYSLLLHLWKKKLLTVTPNVNLVSNIGFGKNASNTTNKKDKRSNMPTYEIGVLNHPKKVKRHLESDRYTFKNVFDNKYSYYPYKLIYFPIRVIKYLYLKLKLYNNPLD
jgi:hypothetical protein